MLPWVLILTLFGALVAVFGQHPAYGAQGDGAGGAAAWTSGGVSICLIVADLQTRSCGTPTLRCSKAATSIRCCSDPGLAIHPPMLYLGYVGFSITILVRDRRTMIEGYVDAAWARLAVAVGATGMDVSHARHRDGARTGPIHLGWGGWWFWDSGRERLA